MVWINGYKDSRNVKQNASYTHMNENKIETWSQKPHSFIEPQMLRTIKKECSFGNRTVKCKTQRVERVEAEKRKENTLSSKSGIL